MEDTNLDRPIAERRARRLNRKLPKRYRDDPPQPPTPVLQPSTQEVAQEPAAPRDLVTRVLKFFRTPRNIFGLSREFYGVQPPTQDPDGCSPLSELCDLETSSRPPSQGLKDCFFPYPNKSLFQLGDWYWNQGVQKSQQSFKNLVTIISDVGFAPADIRETNWAAINATLATNREDQVPDIEQWLSEDRGWSRTAISILVPFHRFMKNPGSQRYIAGELYHRPIISVIKERLTDSTSHDRFHYEPYRLLWKPREGVDEMRVHGELYTSTAFLDAHKALLESPPEPGCDAPRAIAALMFWSDATHLTSFGNAKLWPCYMFFGNDSKYSRCKPTYNLCNHIAYFQTVHTLFYLITPLLTSPCSFLTLSKTLPLYMLVEGGQAKRYLDSAVKNCFMPNWKFFLTMISWMLMCTGY